MRRGTALGSCRPNNRRSLVSSLDVCRSCPALLPKNSLACPSCGATSLGNRIVRLAAKLAGGSAFAVTLMACYGLPPLPDCNRDEDLDGDNASNHFLVDDDGERSEACQPPGDAPEDCDDDN